MNGSVLVVVRSLTLLAVAGTVSVARVVTKNGVQDLASKISPESLSRSPVSGATQPHVQLKTTDPTLFQQDPPNTGMSNTCQVWSTPIPNSGGACECGAALYGVVGCDNSTHRTYLKSCYCMSYIESSNSTVVGACVYTCYLRYGATERGLRQNLLPASVSQLSDRQCDYTNRDGLLCGRCKNGFSPPVYSYDLRCVNSTECTNNNMWVKYTLVAFLPLTVFYIIVIIFRISATSPKMNGFVFACQLMSAPVIIRGVVLALGDPEYSHPFVSFVVAYWSITGIWNLDFFRMVYSPFCLNPHTSTLQVLALDYVVAIYPLVLTGLTYALVELHDHNFRIIVWMWKPFHKCFVRFRRQWDIRTSLIDAFATFLLLSYAKLLSVSFDILYPTPIYNESGKLLNKSNLYFDATVEYFGKEHLPYGVTAIVVLLVFIICPLLLLCLYPCRCFQKCLNHCRLQCLMLRTFMDAFQGCYKDGTNGTRDCRYLAGVYLVVRIASFAAYAVSLQNLYLQIIGIIPLLFALLIVLVQPYKSRVYNVVDTVFLFTIVLGCIAGSMGFSIYPEINYLRPAFYLLFLLLIFSAMFLPHIYMTGLLLYWLLVQKGCLRRVRNKLQCLESRRTHSEEPLPDRLLHPEEYVQLPQPVANRQKE